MGDNNSSLKKAQKKGSRWPAPEQNIEQALAAKSPLASESFQQFFQGKKSEQPQRTAKVSGIIPSTMWTA